MTNPYNENQFAYIKNNLKTINENIELACEKINRDPKEITIIGVTKTVPPEVVNFSLTCGINTIGENKVQEYLSKKDCYSDGKKVHFIGHLQSNKVKYICDTVDAIESVDSLKTVEIINKYAKICEKVMMIFIEVNMASEASKSGISYDDVADFIQNSQKYNNILISGLMAIPPISSNSEETRYYFKKMKALFDNINKNKYNKCELKYLSMGMSHDYVQAIEEGANIVRLGTCLYGMRNYNIK